MSEVVEKEHSILYEIATIPNTMTLFRALAAPWAYKAVANEPGEKWLQVGLVSLTDLEGNVGRLEKLPVIGRFLSKIGFRTSEIGRQGDPVADTIYGAAVASGGLKSGAIPKWLARSMIYQKAVKSAITVGATLEGTTLEVHNTGKAGELLTALGSYACIAAEDSRFSQERTLMRVSGASVAAGGLALSWLATIGGYAHEAGYINVPTLNNMLARVDKALEKVTPGA